MDKGFILKSKLIIPELSRNVLLTNRLKKLHERMDSSRAVAICAPAGYGKTTLVVSYLKSVKNSRICWYRLDPDDIKLPVFTAHLKEALFPSEESEFASSNKAIENTGDIQSNPNLIIKALCREMWEHYSKDDGIRTIIVLDDFQNVAHVGDICDMVKYMLDNMPPSCVLFVLTRANINIFSEKQKLEKNVLELGPESLAFSNSEIEALLFSMGQGNNDKELINFIEEQTEGWIAGIIILYQVVKSKLSENKDAQFIADKPEHVEALFRYMSMEVFSSVEEATQNALAKLALLHDFSEKEASQILDIGNIKEIIEQCIDFGMFIQRIPGDPVIYSFHSLFREFLQLVLKERFTENQIEELHLKAAEYYMIGGIYGRAAEHLAKCSNSDAAMDMVTREGFNKFKIGETGQLKMWLDLLPDSMVRDNPVLLLFKAQLMPNSRQPEMVDTLKEVMRLSLQKNNLETYFDAATVLIYILMCSNNMKELLEITLDNPSRRSDISAELKNTLAILDIVRYISQEQYSKAQLASESILYDLLPEDSKWLYLILSSIVYYCIGRLDHGELCMKTALILYADKSIEPSRGFILLFLSIILTLKNQRELRTSYISEIIAIGEKYEYEYLCAQGKRLAAFERYLSYDTDAAIESMEKATYLYNRIINKGMAAACRLLRCLWSITQYSPAPDIEEARNDLLIIQREIPGMMIYESSLSILGAIAREAGEYEFAEQCLLSAIDSAKEKDGSQVLCGALFHTAKLYYDKGVEQQGHIYLKQAMELGAINKYFMFWDIHISTLLEMVLLSIRYDYYIDYAHELLVKFYDNNTAKYLTEKSKSIKGSRLNVFVNNFVAKYKAGENDKLYLVKASLFGKPEISVNGIKIPETEWKTKKVKGLLDYLLLSCGDTVSKELLAEVLWPGSDSKSGLASQRTALYYLRRILSKYGVEIKGHNTFIYESPEGLQIRRDETLELDIDEFLQLESQLSQVAYFDTNLKTEILEKMIALYKGELMEGSDYGDIVYHERERFRSIYVEACKKLGLIYIKCSKLRNAEEILKLAFAAEPYNENICLELIRLYNSEGRRSKAIKLYYKFKKCLKEELGINVDKRLTEAIRS